MTTSTTARHSRQALTQPRLVQLNAHVTPALRQEFTAEATKRGLSQHQFLKLLLDYYLTGEAEQQTATHDQTAVLEDIRQQLHALRVSSQAHTDRLTEESAQIQAAFQQRWQVLQNRHEHCDAPRRPAVPDA